MTDAAIERQFEANLKRCRDQGHRLFYFRVNDAEVAVCARCNIRFIEDVTAGDGSEWDTEARAALEASMASHPAGKSASGTITCCKPLFLSKPGGKVFSHSRFCKESPGEKVDIGVYVQGRQWERGWRR